MEGGRRKGWSWEEGGIMHREESRPHVRGHLRSYEGG